MVEQERLKGSIDQIDGVISFDSGSISTAATGRHIRQWDAGVQGLAEDVERVAASIVDAFPVSISVKTYYAHCIC